MDHNGTRPTITPLPNGISGELRDWYSVVVGDNKYIYRGRVFGSSDVRFPNGHKMYTGYIVGISITIESTIVTDSNRKQWICYAEHQHGANDD